MKSTRKFVYPNKILDRLRDVYALRSDAELARFLGINPSTVATWRTKRTMKYDRIFERAGDLNLHWLLTGEGASYPVSSNRNDSEHSLPDLRHHSIPPIPYLETEQVAVLGLTDEQASTREPDATLVPFTLPEPFVRQELNSDPAHLFLFRAPGDSMEPTIRYRDFLLINRSVQTPVSGRIFLVRLNRSLFCKRIQELPDGRLHLLSDNSNYPPMEIHSDDEPPELIGMVVWVGRTL